MSVVPYRDVPRSPDALAAVLREDAHRPTTEDRRDGRPACAFDWVSAYVSAFPNERPIVEAAYFLLLSGEDPLAAWSVLEQQDLDPDHLVGVLCSALQRPSVRSWLAQADSPAHDGRSLLGEVVHVLANLGVELERVPAPTATALALISAARDGWPMSHLLALRTSFDASQPLLMPLLLGLDDSARDDVIRWIMSLGPPFAEHAFAVIGTEGDLALRRQVFDVAKALVDKVAAERDELISAPWFRTLSQAAQQHALHPPPDPTPRYRSLLRVDE